MLKFSVHELLPNLVYKGWPFASDSLCWYLRRRRRVEHSKEKSLKWNNYSKTRFWEIFKCQLVGRFVLTARNVLKRMAALSFLLSFDFISNLYHAKRRKQITDTTEPDPYCWIFCLNIWTCTLQAVTQKMLLDATCETPPARITVVWVETTIGYLSNRKQNGYIIKVAFDKSFIQLLLLQLYNYLWVLACPIISFHCFFSCTFCFQFFTPILPRSFLTSSSHLNLGLPFGLVAYGFHLYMILGILSFVILSTCPQENDYSFKIEQHSGCWSASGVVFIKTAAETTARAHTHTHTHWPRRLNPFVTSGTYMSHLQRVFSSPLG